METPGSGFVLFGVWPSQDVKIFGHKKKTSKNSGTKAVVVS